MRYLSVCSGIEAASVAWHPLGWEAVGFSEIEAFPSAVLAHHFPTVPNFGDLTRHAEWNLTPGAIDLVVGGTPCQSFSVAGLRAGMADPRGNLALTFISLVDRQRPRWVIWENVPGALSSNGGRDFGSILGALGELGYGWSYRILDAQHFGVPQRRRRIFLVGYLGDWRPPAAVLFEPEGLRGDPPKGGKARKGAPSGLGNRVETIGTICADSHPGSYTGQDAYTGRLIPAFTQSSFGGYREGCGTLKARGGDGAGGSETLVTAAHPTAVRRLTPMECERLQGFPDGWTAIPYRGKPAADGPRYKAIGNSMAVPVMRWIGQRIKAWEEGGP